MKAKAEKAIKNAEFAKEAIKNPVDFKPYNLGNLVNSDRYEYFPTLTTDEQTLIFTRRVAKKAEKYMTSSGDDEDFFMTKKRNGEWLPAINMGEPLNSAYREGAQCISPDGQYIYFTGCNRPDGKGLCDIYVAKKKGNSWSKPQNLGYPVNTGKWESQPSLSSDGKTLYFASDRGGGKGSIDIWKSVKNEDGTWSKPQNLSEINTSQKEEAPFMHADGQTLYFASSGHPGMGGMDLFYTRLKNGKFEKPVNLGYPLNTASDENTLTVGASGTTAYFASDREDGVGKLDIYGFELHPEARPNKVSYTLGMVYDADTKKPLEANFQLIDLATEEVVVKSHSDEVNGEFLVCLPPNRDYALNVSKEGYLFHSENFSLKTSKNAEPYKLLIPLQDIAIDKPVVLKNVFFETAKYNLVDASKVELNKLLNFLNNNPSITIEVGGHTDNQGDKVSNQLLSENRAKSVMTYLITNGISEARISAKGYGDEKPIADNVTEEGRAKNRRTEFKIIKK